MKVLPTSACFIGAQVPAPCSLKAVKWRAEETGLQVGGVYSSQASFPPGTARETRTWGFTYAVHLVSPSTLLYAVRKALSGTAGWFFCLSRSSDVCVVLQGPPGPPGLPGPAGKRGPRVRASLYPSSLLFHLQSNTSLHTGLNSLK